MRRDRLGIINEILEYSKNGARKTKLMKRANISFGQTRVYLPFLEQKGLLRVENNGSDSKPVYETSEKGKEFLERYRETKAFLA